MVLKVVNDKKLLQELLKSGRTSAFVHTVRVAVQCLCVFSHTFIEYYISRKNAYCEKMRNLKRSEHFHFYSIFFKSLQNPQRIGAQEKFMFNIIKKSDKHTRRG